MTYQNCKMLFTVDRYVL